MTYCFKCLSCGFRLERPVRTPAQPDPCPACGAGILQRDWRGEGVGLGNISELRKDREFNGKSGAAELFLPTAKDFAGPEDPDGSKGLRAWADRHGPRDSNKRPYYPEGIKRRSF